MMLTSAVGQQPRVDAKLDAKTYRHEGNDNRLPVIQRRNPGMIGQCTGQLRFDDQEEAANRINIIKAVVLMPVTVMLPS